MDQFKLVAPYQPAGGQGAAIDSLLRSINQGERDQILLGVTGSGKTFTMANVIAKMNRPTLVIAHNNLGGPALRRIQRIFPRKRSGVFCLLL